MLVLGYFEGLDSERAIAWRTADSLSIRGFLGLELHEAPPDHSTVSRTPASLDDMGVECFHCSIDLK